MRRLLTFVFLVHVGTLQAAEPAVRNLSVRGLQIGGTTTLTVDGDDLGKAPRLLLPFPAKQILKPGGSDKQAVFDVVLPADLIAGYANLRVVTEGGVSLPVLIGIDRLPQKPLAAAVESLPIALHGAVSGATVVEAKFAGQAGQKVTIEVEAQRLGSKLRPILHLYSPKKLQLAWSWTNPTLLGDTRLEVVLPEAGEYVAALHDAEYAGAAPGHFRLKIGQWSYVDQVFPPVVQRGQPANLSLTGAGLEKLALPPLKNVGVEPLPLPKEPLWSGPRPFVRVGVRPELLEQAEPGKIQDLPAGAVAVSGRLLAPYEEDRYNVPTTPGTKIRFEVFAERLGSPIDVALVVRNDAGGDLARAEDAPGTLDPVLEYAVPAKTDSVVVAVVDAQGRGSARGMYRLTVDTVKAVGTEVDFRVGTNAQRIGVTADGFSVLPITIDRASGFQGAVQLAADGLPAGIAAENTLIPEGGEGALVVLRRKGDAGGEAILRWKGIASPTEEREVGINGHPLERLQPWLATEIALALIAAKASEYQIDWKDLPPDAGLVQAGKPEWKLKLVKPNEKITAKLTLLTSQAPKLVNNQPDPNQMIRLEKPSEVPGKGNEGVVSIVIPPQLNAASYDVTVQAEFLDEKKALIASAFAPVRRMAVRESLIVTLQGPKVLEAAADPKTGLVFAVKGTIERREGLAGDVTLALAPLPAGASAAPLAVKGDAKDFEIKVTLPANQPAGDLPVMKLSASGVPDPKQPNVRVKSKDVDVTLKVLEAKKK